jgi:uncharacterized coiled-coil protein SlyX
MNSPVPKAVRDQLQRAETLRQQMVAAQATPAPAADATPVETPAPAPSEVQAVQSVQETPPAPAPAAETPPQATPPAPAPQTEETWEHKYKVLQGMQQSLAQERRELFEQNRQLRDLIARMQEQQRQQAPAPAQPAPQTSSLIKPEEVEEYGADLLDVIARKAKEQYGPLVEQMQAHIQRLEQQLGGRMQQVEQVASVSAKDSFFSKLDATVPYWEKLNTEQDFLNWLDTPDELSGVVRREMFNRAYQNFDAPRIAKFFETYANQSGFNAQAAPAPAANAMVPTVPLNNLAAPPKSPSAPAPVGKKVWTRQEIAAFYENARKGVYKGKEAERSRLERDIFDASRDGRIQ